MRYGKIYFYDRLGNKVQADGIPSVRESVLETGKGTMTVRRSGLGPNFAPLSPPFAARGFVPEDPLAAFGGDPFTGDLPSPDSHPLPEGLGLAGVVAELSPRKQFALSPERDDDQRTRLAKTLEGLDLEANGLGPQSPVARRPLAHARSTGRLVDEVVAHRTVDEEDGLCEHCQLECQRQDEAHRTAQLKSQLEQHVSDVNAHRAKHKSRRELLPMGVLPPFMNRDEDGDRRRRKRQQEVYRQELEADMTRRRLEAELERVRNQDQHNIANTEDAKAFAWARDEQQHFERDEKSRHRDILERQAELRKVAERAEGERLEWWEKRGPADAKPVERDERFLSDQLRRNEMLQKSVEKLEQFKKDRHESDVARHELNRQRFDALRQKIEEQSKLLHGPVERGGERVGVMRRQSPSVFQAWQDAHAANEGRYRVLQDLDLHHLRRRPVQEETRCVRCRRCHRLIRRETHLRPLEGGR